MGKIQVGQKHPKNVDLGGFTIVPNDGTTAENKDSMISEEKKARAARLAEIQAMDEQEQLPLLLEEGFEDEAKALSEKLATHDAEGREADGGQNEGNPEKTSEKKTSAEKGATKKN